MFCQLAPDTVFVWQGNKYRKLWPDDEAPAFRLGVEQPWHVPYNARVEVCGAP